MLWWSSLGMDHAVRAYPLHFYSLDFRGKSRVLLPVGQSVQSAGDKDFATPARPASPLCIPEQGCCTWFISQVYRLVFWAKSGPVNFQPGRSLLNITGPNREERQKP